MSTFETATHEPTTVTQASVEEWLIAYIADLSGTRKDKISITTHLRKYGLDSASAVTLSGDMMDWLKCEVDPTLLYEHPTIEKAASHVMTLIKKDGND